MSRQNAGIYFFGIPPSSKQLAGMVAGAAVAETIVVTIDPQWRRAVELRGIRAWLLHFPESKRAPPGVQQFLADLDRTTTCYGSVISPSYDGEGKVVKFLKAMVEPSGGFFFTYQSFYSSSGEHIAGIDGDPSALGGKDDD